MMMVWRIYLGNRTELSTILIHLPRTEGRDGYAGTGGGLKMTKSDITAEGRKISLFGLRSIK